MTGEAECLPVLHHTDDSQQIHNIVQYPKVKSKYEGFDLSDSEIWTLPSY